MYANNETNVLPKCAIKPYTVGMARRLIGLREMDALEGLVERHYRLQERLEELEAQAATFDLIPPGVAELSESLKGVKLELTDLLEGIVRRLESSRERA